MSSTRALLDALLLINRCRGIGAGIATELGRRGANVVVNYASPKSKAAADTLVHQIESCGSGARALALQADVVSSEGQTEIINSALQLSGMNEINIVVHNAGNGDDAFLPDITEEFYEMQTDINVKGQ